MSYDASVSKQNKSHFCYNHCSSMDAAASWHHLRCCPPRRCCPPNWGATTGWATRVTPTQKPVYWLRTLPQSGDPDARGGRGYVAHLQPAASGGQSESLHYQVTANFYHIKVTAPHLPDSLPEPRRRMLALWSWSTGPISLISAVFPH